MTPYKAAIAATRQFYQMFGIFALIVGGLFGLVTLALHWPGYTILGLIVGGLVYVWVAFYLIERERW